MTDIAHAVTEMATTTAAEGEVDPALALRTATVATSGTTETVVIGTMAADAMMTGETLSATRQLSLQRTNGIAELCLFNSWQRAYALAS